MISDKAENRGKQYRKSILNSSLVVFILPLLLTGCGQDISRDTARGPEGDNTGTRYLIARDVTPEVKRGEITFDISIEPAGNSSDVKLWLPYPVSNVHQAIEDVQIDGNYDYIGVYRDSESGSLVLFCDWKNPEEKPQVTYSFDVTREEIIRNELSLEEATIPVAVEKYLLPTSKGPVTGEVKELALKITESKKTILDRAIAIYDYIVENGQRDPTITGCGNGDVCMLLPEISGKCADIHSVFVALARSVGIPAREIFGTRIAKEGDITGAYHCRGEFYLPGYGWVPVDPSDVRKKILVKNLTLSDPSIEEARDYYFGNQTETYIDFYPGRDITLNPRQSGPPLNYLMYPYAEVDGKPLDYHAQDELQYTVTFREFGERG